MTQWGPLSPTLFDIMVDTVVSEVQIEVCGPQEAQNGLGWDMDKHNVVLYADDSHIMGQNPIWFQKTLMVIV